MQFWGSMLAVVLWSVWTFRNHNIFRSSGIISANALFFSIFHLFSSWTGALFPIHTGITGAVSAASTRALGPSAQLGGFSSTADPGRDQPSDEDLLD
jgi:hypothetical protein